MKTTTFRIFTLLAILLLCSCSDVSDVAQDPEAAEARLQKLKEIEEAEKTAPPTAQVMLESKQLFQPAKTEEYADDPLLQQQDDLQGLETGTTDSDQLLNLESGDFSKSLVP